MSLLLDALKKAALEKQRRDQQGTTQATAEPTPVYEPSREEKKEEPKTPVRETTLSLVPEIPSPPAAENQLADRFDLEISPDLELIAEGYLDPSLNQPKVEIITAHSNSTDDNAFVLEIDDFELSPTKEEAVELESPALVISEENETITEPMVAPTPSIENAVAAENAAMKENAVAKEEAVAREKVESKSTEPIPAANSKENSSNDTDSKNQTVVPPITAYTDEGGKSAFAQLLGRSQQARKIEKRKKKFFFLALIITAGSLVLLYYFYLLKSNPTALMPSRTPAVTNNEEVALTEPNVEAENKEAPSTETSNTEHASGENQKPTTAENEQVSKEAQPGNKATSTTVLPSASNSKIDENKNVETVAAEKTSLNELNINSRSTVNIERTQPKIETRSSMESRPSTKRQFDRPPVDPNIFNDAIQQGYDAFQRGDIITAEAAYHEALRLSPKHRDAILGAAAVAARQGRNSEALRLYQQQLQADPQDVNARAGMMSMVANNRQSSQIETDLNLMLRDNPDAAYLHFMRGSILARRQEWSEAQSAFFNAWQRDSNNPDYAFNLAVSLDHLGATKEALNYYRKALELSAIRGANFSGASIETRIHTLEALTP